MRLDHIAIRTTDRNKAADFYMQAFGYKFQCEFEIFFDEEKKEKAMCIALEPPEKINGEVPWICHGPYDAAFHLAPEIFLSQGNEGSIVAEWVKKRGGVAGIHHTAYQCDDVAAKMKEWTEKGFADFSTSKPLTCEDLTQVFSKLNPMTGLIYEFIQRKQFGFCKDNVKRLMESTRGD